MLVAFMPPERAAINFEDPILISERIVRDDVFTSIPHRGIRNQGPRYASWVKRKSPAIIPNVGEEALKNLDEAGIVYIGAEVNPGDILIGKVTPKPKAR